MALGPDVFRGRRGSRIHCALERSPAPSGSKGAAVKLPRRSGAKQSSTSYADAVALADPAVVSIFTTKVQTERRSQTFRDPYLQPRNGS
jgi:hypothetical protein